MFKNKTFHALLPSAFVALLCGLTFCAYVPAVSYLSNASQFTFSMGGMLLGILLPFVCVVAVVFALLFLANRFVFRKSLYRTPKTGGEISPLHVLLALIILCVWLEGFLLSRGLPELTGEKDLYTSMTRLVMDCAVWAFVLLMGLWFWRALAGKLGYILLALCVLMGTGVADAAMGGRETGVTDTKTVSTRAVLDRASFHTGDNVLILLMDAMSTALVQDYIEEHPEAVDALDGFTFFENNMETASSTQWSVSTMMRGDMYTGGPVAEYQTALFDLPGSLPQAFIQNGYDFYSSSLLSMYNTYRVHGENITTNQAGVVAMTLPLYGQLSLRFVPYVLKNPIANTVGFDTRVTTSDEILPDGNLAALSQENPVSSDETTYLVLAHAAQTKGAQRPTLQFHHVNGAHKPYVVDRNGNRLPAEENYTVYGLQEQSAWTLNHALALLAQLKENGLYDSTTIVLMGDHGDRNNNDGRNQNAYTQHAALLIKPADSHGALVRSAVPMSSGYLAWMLPALHLERESLQDLTADLPQTRTIMVGESNLQVYEGADVTSMKMVEQIPVEQTFTPNRLAVGTEYTLAVLGDNENKAYPLETIDADIANGWGLRAIVDYFAVSFLVDSPPGETLDVTFLLETSTTGGEVQEFEPFTMTVKDAQSGREHLVAVSEYRTHFTIEDVQVSDQESIRFEFTREQIPANMRTSLVEIELAKAE